MMSLAQAAFYLLHHLFSVHGLAIRKESQVISGIFQLLAKSLQLAKSSFVKSASSKEADDSCQDIFQRAVQSLLSFLDENFRESLFNVSKDLRQEEFQVRCYVHLLDCSSSSAKFQLPLPYTAPPPPSTPFIVVPLFELRVEYNNEANTLTLNRGKGEGCWLFFFSEFISFESNVSTIIFCCRW